MVHYDEFDEQLSKCPIKKITTIQDIEQIRNYYFSIIDKYNLGYKYTNIIYNLDNALLIIYCNRNTLFNLKFITKLDSMDEICLDYNKYCYYNITDFDELMQDYKNFKNFNDTSFLESNNGNEDDWYKKDKHLKDRRICPFQGDVAPYV